jgi:hypothetical protein
MYDENNIVQTYTLEFYQTDKMLYKLFVIYAHSKEWTSYIAVSFFAEFQKFVFWVTFTSISVSFT